MIKYNRCPFCGNAHIKTTKLPNEFGQAGNYHRSYCPRCLCSGPRTVAGATAAVKLWNTRHTDTINTKNKTTSGESESSTDLPHWNICYECAHDKGAKIPDGKRGITVTTGTCGYCKTEEVTLVPIVDFNWPDGTMAIFD